MTEESKQKPQTETRNEDHCCTYDGKWHKKATLMKYCYDLVGRLSIVVALLVGLTMGGYSAHAKSFFEDPVGWADGIVNETKEQIDKADEKQQEIIRNAQQRVEDFVRPAYETQRDFLGSAQSSIEKWKKDLGHEWKETRDNWAHGWKSRRDRYAHGWVRTRRNWAHGWYDATHAWWDFWGRVGKEIIEEKDSEKEDRDSEFQDLRRVRRVFRIVDGMAQVQIDSAKLMGQAEIHINEWERPKYPKFLVSQPGSQSLTFEIFDYANEEWDTIFLSYVLYSSTGHDKRLPRLDKTKINGIWQIHIPGKHDSAFLVLTVGVPKQASAEAAAFKTEDIQKDYATIVQATRERLLRTALIEDEQRRVMTQTMVIDSGELAVASLLFENESNSWAAERIKEGIDPLHSQLEEYLAFVDTFRPMVVDIYRSVEK